MLKVESLKRRSGYIGAGRLYYTGLLIEEYYKSGNYKEMLEYYPTLVETVSEFKTYSRKILAE